MNSDLVGRLQGHRVGLFAMSMYQRHGFEKTLKERNEQAT